MCVTSITPHSLHKASTKLIISKLSPGAIAYACKKTTWVRNGDDTLSHWCFAQWLLQRSAFHRYMWLFFDAM